MTESKRPESEIVADLERTLPDLLMRDVPGLLEPRCAATSASSGETGELSDPPPAPPRPSLGSLVQTGVQTLAASSVEPAISASASAFGDALCFEQRELTGNQLLRASSQNLVQLVTGSASNRVQICPALSRSVQFWHRQRRKRPLVTYLQGLPDLLWIS